MTNPNNVNEELNVESLISRKRTTDTEINPEIEKCSSPKAVLFYGQSGSGKSTLVNILNGIPVKVIKKYINCQFEGEGVGSGSKSITKIYRVIPNEIINISFIDCAGNNDTGGRIDEILNIYYLNKLFMKIKCNIKILLVIPCYEIRGRRTFIESSIDQLERIFPDPAGNFLELKKCMGLVFSNSDPNQIAKNYLNALKEESSIKLEGWCNYFLSTLDKVFLFPTPSEEQVGVQYKGFPDFEKMKNFIQNEDFDMKNLYPQIGFNADIQQTLKNFEMKIRLKINEEAVKLSGSIISSYNNEKDIDKLREYPEKIALIAEEPFDTIEHFKHLLEQKLNVQFDFTNWKSLNEFALFLGEKLKKTEILHCSKVHMKAVLVEVLLNITKSIERINQFTNILQNLDIDENNERNGEDDERNDENNNERIKNLMENIINDIARLFPSLAVTVMTVIGAGELILTLRKIILRSIR